MSRKIPCYEDFFRLPEPNPNTTEPSLFPANHGMSGDTQGNPIGGGMSMPATGWQQGEQQMYNPQFNNPERIRPLFPSDEGRKGPMTGMGGEPELFRPLRTSESYEESNWNLPDSSRQAMGQESYFENERNDFMLRGQFEMHNAPFGQNFNDADDYCWYDRQPYYDEQPQGRQPEPYNQRPRLKGRKGSQSRRKRSKNQKVVSQSASRPQQASESSDGRQQESSGPSNDPEPAKDQKDDNTKDQEDDKEEGDDDSDEDTSFCKLCNVHFETIQKYFQHTRGMLHTQRQMAAKKDKLGLRAEEEQQQQQQQQQSEEAPKQQTGLPQFNEPPPAQQKVEATVDTGGNEQEEEDWEEDWEGEEDEDSNEFTCELCDIKTTGTKALRAHENGRLHKTVQEAVDSGTPVPQRIYVKLGPKTKVPQTLKPVTLAVLGLKPTDGPSVLLDLLKNVPEAVVGTAFIKEGRSGKQPTFLCITCESICDSSGIMSHIIGSKHRMKYLRAHEPAIYEHVRSHGGKKSQLSAFLEEVCSDIEKREGRNEPIMDRPSAEQKKEDEAVKDEKTAEDKKGDKKTDMSAKDKTKQDVRMSYTRRNLPHNVVMALYKEERMREGPGGPDRGWEWGGPEDPGRFGGRGYPPGPEFPPPRPGPDMGPYYNMSGPPDMSGPMGPGFLGPPGPGMFRPPGPNMPGPPGPYPPPPFRDFPDPYMSEEERLKQMYEYETYLYNHPMVLASPEEARCRMFAEYERLGIPYDIACDRVLIQEERRVKMMDYMRNGLTLKEAQGQLRKLEARRLLIREYEQQGLDPREARWRAIVEEERNKLYEKYEDLGISPAEARTKIMGGEDRMHLVQEFERHGMTPDEALNRAIAEEDRLKAFEASQKPSRAAQDLDDIADRRVLMAYLEQGDTREQAENKAIAVLRRQGVPTQEAILRVQKIHVPVPEKPGKETPTRGYDDSRTPPKSYEDRKTPPKSYDDRRTPPKNYDDRRTPPKNYDDRKTLPRSYDDSRKPSRNYDDSRIQPKSFDDIRKHRDTERKGRSRSPENFDNITPEEAKERLFKEYEKRGVPREKARIALIQELVRSGVPEEEARRRFSDLRPTKTGEREERRKKKKYSDRERSRSRSSSSSRSSRKRRRRSPSPDRKKYPKSRVDDRGRTDLRFDRPRLTDERRKDEKDRERRGRDSRERERSREGPSRPTLTLGEEIKQKARELKRAEILSRLEDSSSSSAKQPRPGTSSQGPQLESKKDDKSVTDLLASLTDNLISSKDDESEAMSMSKALTSALMKYRLNTVTEEKEKPSGSATTTSFVERRIQDAKKLFETKMLPPKETPGPSGLKMTIGGDRRVVWMGNDTSSSVSAESFGLPPPVPTNNPQPSSYSYGSQSSTSSAYPSSQPRFQVQASQGKKTVIPRVLLAQKASTKGGSSSRHRP